MKKTVISLGAQPKSGASHIAIRAACAVAALGFAFSAASIPARADVTDELLDIMKTKGDLSAAQYHKLKERHEAEKRTAYAPPPPPAGSSKDGYGTPTYVTALPKGVGVRIGNVDVKVSGDISFFAIEDFPDKYGATTRGGLIGNHYNNSNAISAGLLPSSIQVGLTTNQNGYDIGAFFGVYEGGNNVTGVGGANSAGSPTALGTSGIDFRQIYGTVGTATGGTVKFGRDIGIFGQDAILNDATIFGSGTPNNNFAPSNTTLGRIGIGYIYADFMPQITYTSPNYNGFTASVGAFSPYNETGNIGSDIIGGTPATLNLNGTTTAGVAGTSAGNLSAQLKGQDTPMVQGRIKYVTPDSVSGGYKDAPAEVAAKLTLSSSFVYQNHQVDFGDTFAPLALGRSIDSWAVDGFARLDWNNFSFVGYGYAGSGVGTTGLFLNGVSFNGQQRDSHGGYGQASYTFFDRLTVGGSYGVSTLDKVSGDSPFLFKDIDSKIGFARYKLTDWVNFQAEYVNTDQTNQGGGKTHDDAIIAGTTFFW